MKAREVLRSYAAGERNFQRVNLRGQSFKGKDLKGADFTEADIRSTNFKNANLQGVNFTRAKAGLQKRWVAFVLMISVLASGLSGLCSIFIGVLVSLLFDSSYHVKFYIGLFSLIFLVILLIITFLKGIIAVAVAVAVAIAVAFTFAVTGGGAVPVAFTFAVTGGGAVAVAFTFAVAGAGAFAVAVAVGGTGGGAVAVAFTFAVAGAGAVAVAGGGAIAVAVAVAVAVALCGFYIGWRALKGDERDAWVRSFAVASAATGGTNFQGANLTDVDFTGATLKNTNFRNAILIGTCFQQAKKLDLARPGNTYLKILKLQQWLIGIGKDKNFDRINLRGVNFQGKSLTDASFIGSNLSEANLQDADLSRALLVQTQLDKTDFTGATLTGAFIEDWDITVDTVLRGVKCDYIFTRLPPDKRPDWLTLSEAESQNPNPQRKPDDWKRNFEDGEFEDFITPLCKTLLDLYHNQPIDPRLAAISFQDLQQNHPQAELELISVARTGKNRDKLHLKGTTSPTADLSTLHAEYFTNIEYLKSLSPEAKEALLMERGATLKMLLEGDSSINIDNSAHQKNNSTLSQTTQSHSGNGDNIAGNKNIQ